MKTSENTPEIHNSYKKYNEMRFLEHQIQLQKRKKKKLLKEIATRNGLSYKSVKKMDQKMRRELING